MLDKVLNNPNLAEYLVSFVEGQNVFLEGEASAALYVLVSGELEVLKGQQVISTMSQPGDIFGEMAFLLGSERTATLRARGQVQAIRIPADKIGDFFRDFPEAVQEMSRVLALRLNRASQALFGFKELCDQLPDAVAISDGEGRVQAWNRAAAKLYGRDWSQVGRLPAEQIFEDPEAYRALRAQVQEGQRVLEAPLSILHPSLGQRHLSLSLSPLKDAKGGYQGMVAIARDVTAAVRLRQRLRLLRRWLFISLGLLALFGVAALITYPYLISTQRVMGQQRVQFRNLLAKDYVLLASLLSRPLSQGDREQTSRRLRSFFEMQEPSAVPYRGLVLLDKDKKVFDARWADPRQDARKMVGTSYEHIKFAGDTDSLHRVLVVYRQAPGGSAQSVELAFELRESDRLLGWLVFVLDPQALQKMYGVEPADLKNMRFPRP
ncbi:MAG: cyclic nucleotide-binding domain-containing protein [Thermodesulfobacteriota bacterium]